MQNFLERISGFFEIKQHSSSIKTEIIAGLTTFLTMVYIVPTNAIIMSKAGMPADALVTATALITFLACVFSGLWGRTPICMSVGMGLNAYFTFGLVGGMGLSWQAALGVVFISSLFFLILSLTPFRRWIIEGIPQDMKHAISAGIGCFIAFIGLKQTGIIVSSEATLVALGDLAAPATLLGLFGIFTVFILSVKGVTGSFIISIAITAVLAWILGLSSLPSGIVGMPASIAPIAMELDISSAATIALMPVIIAFMITHMFDSIGTIAGVGSRAGLFDGGRSKSLERTLQVDAAASTLGSALGVSTTTCFIESASGVEAGGRTGLSAVVCGLFFLLTMFLLPLFNSIHPNAIYPVLVMIGVLMFGELRRINFSDLTISVPAFLTVLVMPLTFSISHGIAAGFVSYVVLKAVRDGVRSVQPVIAVIAILSAIPMII